MVRFQLIKKSSLPAKLTKKAPFSSKAPLLFRSDLPTTW